MIPTGRGFCQGGFEAILLGGLGGYGQVCRPYPNIYKAIGRGLLLKRDFSPCIWFLLPSKNFFATP